MGAPGRLRRLVRDRLAFLRLIHRVSTVAASLRQKVRRLSTGTHFNQCRNATQTTDSEGSPLHPKIRLSLCRNATQTADREASTLHPYDLNLCRNTTQTADSEGSTLHPKIQPQPMQEHHSTGPRPLPLRCTSAFPFFTPFTLSVSPIFCFFLKNALTFFHSVI